MYCAKGTCKQQCQECASDFDNGIDHYADCEDPLNCNCENLVPCPRCNGQGYVYGGIFGENIDTCPYCEEGLVLKSEFNYILGTWQKSY